MRIVLDTSVLVAAMKSSRGASYQLLARIPSPDFQPALSIALYTEWRAVLSRPEHLPANINPEQMQRFLRYLMSVSHLQDIHYLWRPFLRDPDDDMVLECAVASSSPYIITHNVRDFQRSNALGVTALSPADFLKILKRKS